MRIGCLQFAPQLGDVNQNLNRADAVLCKRNPQNLDLLVLPELAFSGYNFKSLKDISPFLEPTAAGITSLWARTTALKYDCVVSVGYPEKVDVAPKWPASVEYYSSAMMVNSDGETIANYRKAHLYPPIDERWALEGPDGFYDGDIPSLGGSVAAGFSMDLNPYKFEAPWSAWEFAYHILHRECNLAIISMAWLTGEDARSYSRKPKDPDLETLSYWIARLEPLIRNEDEEEIIIVLCNRCGVEDDAVYAGTSAVIGIQGGEVKLYGVLGRGEKDLLIVDTTKKPQAKLVHDPTIVAGTNKTVDGHDSNASKSSQDSVHTNSSTTTRSSYYEDSNPIGSIASVLAAASPLSPVEPFHSHSYFGNEITPEIEKKSLISTIEMKQDVSPGCDVPPALAALGVAMAEQELRSLHRTNSYDTGSSNETRQHQLKSAKPNGNVVNRAHSSTPVPEDGPAAFERPQSPKSRNCSRSRTREQAPKDQALYAHDLAGEEPDIRNPPNRNRAHSRSNGIGSRNASRHGAASASIVNTQEPATFTQYMAFLGRDESESETEEEVEHEAVGLNLAIPRHLGAIQARPRSTGW